MTATQTKLNEPEMDKIASALTVALATCAPFQSHSLLNVLMNMVSFYAIQFGFDKQTLLDCMAESYMNIQAATAAAPASDTPS
jgi:hypothetical protein